MKTLTNKEKTKILKKIEYYYEKREDGGCFLCGESFQNNATRDLGGLHGHHVSQENKEFEPSQCLRMGFVKGRLERRKCCPLCAICHLMVHNDEGTATKFDAKMEEEQHIVGEGGIIKKR